MASPEKFAANMKKRAKAVITNANQVKRKTAIVIATNLVFFTPVDTGRARGNWVIELGAPRRVENVTTDKSGRGALREAKERINQSSPGESIFISNNLPYIVPLNNGSSAQAPAGFVETSVRLGTNFVKKSGVL